MSSYHSSFTYLNKNSRDEGFIIASFSPDDGETDSFLGMDQIYTDNYDGTERNLYGSKYNAVATISITLIKSDGTEFSVADNRRVLKWLTGNRTASWLDLYEGNEIKYSFFCNTTEVQQYKQDARVIGITAVFTSIHPWAWSAPQSFDCYIGEEMLNVDDNGVLYKEYGDSPALGIDENGVVFNDTVDETRTFNITASGVIYNDKIIDLEIDNQSDDLYSYIYLTMTYKNTNSPDIKITNVTLDEETLISNLAEEETVILSENQFIISDQPNKIFGDSFNFVWPRLAPGKNIIRIDASTGKGTMQFTYRYPIKIGDCAIDTDNLIC